MKNLYKFLEAIPQRMHRRAFESRRFFKLELQNVRSPKVPPFIVPAFFTFTGGLYILTDGAPTSMRLNATFNRAVLRDAPPAHLYIHKLWDWCGKHPPMSTEKMKIIMNTLPDRIVVLDIWKEDNSGVFRFHSGCWRANHDRLKEEWIEPSQRHQFTENNSLVGSLAAGSDWNFQCKLHENDQFLRATEAENAKLQYGHGVTFRNNGSKYVLAVYSSGAPIGSSIVRPIKELLTTNFLNDV